MTQMFKNAKSWLPGLIISAICIILILYFVDLRDLAVAIREADPRWLAASVIMAVVWLSMRGVVWRTLLRQKASYRDVFLTLNEGYLLNNFLPLRLAPNADRPFREFATEVKEQVLEDYDYLYGNPADDCHRARARPGFLGSHSFKRDSVCGWRI